METDTTTLEKKVPDGNAIQHYVTLTRSPLLLSPIIESFFRYIRPSNQNLLLGYLVLPVVLYPPSRNFLFNANARSSVRSFCSDQSRIAGLPQRVAELRTTTNLAIQNAINCGRLVLHSDLALGYLEQEASLSRGMPSEIKAAMRLASIFEPYDVPTIYRLLGVTNL